MRKLLLNDDESKELLEFGVIHIDRNGLEIIVKVNESLKNLGKTEYDIMVVNPFNKVILKEVK